MAEYGVLLAVMTLAVVASMMVLGAQPPSRVRVRRRLLPG